MRKGKIELRFINNNYEIVEWFPNHYYGKEADYIYDPLSDSYHNYMHTSFIHKTCFENPETCMVLSFIEKGVPRFVGNRPLELEYTEMVSFLFLLRKGIKMSLKSKK